MKTPTQPVLPKTYSLAQLTSMLALADLAIQLDTAQLARRMAQAAYHDKIHEYERIAGRVGGRIDPRKKEYSGVIEYTAEAYHEFEKSKRQVYNIKRRMETAVRRLRA